MIDSGIEGMIYACQFARENKLPYFGICLGMQISIIEFSRNVLKLKNANSTEFNPKTKYPVIGLVTEWKDASGKIEHRNENSNLGGTMRLGGQKCLIKKSSLSHKLYNKLTITEGYNATSDKNVLCLSHQFLSYDGNTEYQILALIKTKLSRFFK